MTDFLTSVFFLGFLLILSGFFSGSETALFSLSKIEKRRLGSRHPFIGKTVDYLLKHPRRTLITILIGNMVVNTVAIVMATFLSVQAFGAAGLTFTIVVFTFVLLFVGEILPKVFAIRNNMLIAEYSAVPLHWLAKIIFPIRWVVRVISDYVLSFLVAGVPGQKDKISENELKALAKIGKEEGVLKGNEERMIADLLNLGNRQVDEIMTPKTDFVAFDVDDGREKLMSLLKKSHFSFIPIYKGTLDNLLGVISTQEFMLDPRKRYHELVRAPYYIPETKPIDELLEEFRKKGITFAICVDEHGGIAGLVTLEDVVEEIFGEFYDEFARVEHLIRAISPDVFAVQAKISLHDLNDGIGLLLQSDSSETLSGWLLERLGRIPQLNEQFDHEGIHFTFTEVTRRRIIAVHIKRKS